MNPTPTTSDGSNPSGNFPMRFSHTFKCGVKATATVSMTSFEVVWSRRPKLRKVEKEYLAWRKRILAEVSEATGIRILVITLQ